MNAQPNEAPPTSRLQQGEPILSGTGLNRQFGGVKAVDAMDFTLRKGAITGLIGPNGAGKSTLFNLVSGVDQRGKGAVLLDGEDISSLPPYQRARRGMVRTFQLSREFAQLTVLENLMLSPQRQLGEHFRPLWVKPRAVAALDEKIYQRAQEVLALSRLKPVENDYAANLSGGQKKLLELARTLMIDCHIILLDEPGAGVNPALMKTLTDMIVELNENHNKTFMIVEHDMDLIAKLCDPVIVMSEGRKLIEGAFEEVRADPRVIDAYLGGSLDG